MENSNRHEKAPVNKMQTKSKTFSIIASIMIASSLTKVSRVVAFSNVRSYGNLRSSVLATPRYQSRFDCLTFTSCRRRGLFMSAMEDVDEAVDIGRTWDLGGLRKEVARLTVRCHKKTGKANERLRKAQAEVDGLTSNDDVTMEELEKCPNLDELEAQVEELRERLKGLNQLEADLSSIKGKNVVLPEDLAKLAISLEVNDEPPKREPRGPKKKKGAKNMKAFRLPYRRFYSVDKTEIRVSLVYWKNT